MAVYLFVFFALLDFSHATISVDQPGERAVCFNGGIAIEFTHPTLGGDSGYLPNILWIRNGSDYVPDGLFEEVSITATKTILTITSGDDFPFGTTYQASIINQVTRGREFSEVVTIIAKVPSEVNLLESRTSLTAAAITVFWDPVSSECDLNVTYKVSCFSNDDNHEEDMEEGNQYTFTNLNPSTTYTVQVNSCYGAHCSDPQEITVRTTSDADALENTKRISWMAIHVTIAMAIFADWF